MSTFKSHPDPSEWDDFVDFESKSWPKKDRRRYWIIPSICFNCESACGILAYVDKETLEIRKIEGNPVHPGSRGRTCAKGVVTPNQLEDPDRVLYPLKRAGKRGAGEWKRVTWDEVLDELGGRIRKAMQEGRQQRADVPRRPARRGRLREPRAAGVGPRRAQQPHERLLGVGAARAFPVDRRRSAVTRLRERTDDPAALVASRVGPLLQSACAAHHRRQSRGARLIVIDPRLSNTSAKADMWLPANPGTEAALLLAIARQLIASGRYNRSSCGAG